ncbi:MAG: hypothetical protein RID07_03490 [Lacipirellulaceae bacterium]
MGFHPIAQGSTITSDSECGRTLGYKETNEIRPSGTSWAPRVVTEVEM